MMRVSVQGVRFSYATRRAHTPALNGVTLSIGDERVALLGPNGSGKSTLMGVLARSIEPDAGSVLHNDDTGHIGMVFQTPALDALLTVRENLTLAGRLHAMDHARIHRRIDDLGAELGISELASKQVRHLSGGQARRVDLARAVLPAPTLLLLDEPSAGLDPHARRSFMDTLARIARERGGAVVLSTHLTDEADRCDRVVLMARGRVVLDGEPGALRAALGEAVLQVHEADDETLAWCVRESLEHRRTGNGVLIAHADPSLVSRCPIGTLGVTLRPPTLEDVYCWHSDGGAPGAAGLGEDAA